MLFQVNSAMKLPDAFRYTTLQPMYKKEFH
jgi:hypothetical protein